VPDVSGKRILIFGDSLSSGAGSPGEEMAAHLAARGANVHVNARIGRSAVNFYSREDAAGQLASSLEFGADMVIIQLGTNDMGLVMSVDRARMIQLRDSLGAGAEVWAFGPPSFRSSLGHDGDAAQVVTMMMSVFGDHFIDLRPLTKTMLTASEGRANDGVHFTAAGGRVVGKRMADELTSAGGGSSLLIATVLGVLAYALFR